MQLKRPYQFQFAGYSTAIEKDSECQALLVGEEIPSNTIKTLPHNQGLTDFINNQVDAQTAHLTNEAYLLNKAGVTVNSIQLVNYGIDFYGDCIITTESQVHTHLGRFDGFRQAVQAGWKYAMTNPLLISELIRDQFSQEKEFDHLLFEDETMLKLIQPELVEIGQMNEVNWQHVADTFVKRGMMKSGYHLEGFLYTDLSNQPVAKKKQNQKGIGMIILGIICLAGFFAWLGFLLFNRKLDIQVQQRTDSLAASEHKFRTFFEMANVGVAQVHALSGNYTRVNKKYCEIVGYSADELINRTYTDITHPGDLNNQQNMNHHLITGEVSEYTIEKRYLKKDGQISWALLSASRLWSANQRPDYILAVIRDITDRKNAEQRLVFAAKVFENSIEGIVVTDADGKILQVNSAFTAITGYSTEEVIGKNPRILKSDRHPPTFYKEMWKKITEEGQWAGEIWNRKKSGEAYPEWLTISAVRNNQGKPTNFVSIFHDNSENLRQQETLKHLAQHDALTGLPNRILINDRLEVALSKIQRSETKLALLYLDLDNFKYINDTFGHTAGDHLLIELSKRLANLMRTGDTIARLGGDEFLVLLAEIDHINTVSIIATRLIECLQKPFYSGDIELSVTASLGVTIAPNDGIDAAILIKNADTAMYRAKQLGKNSYLFFAPDLDIQAHLRRDMENKLRESLHADEFELHYQPLVHITSGKIVGAEPLLRLRKADKLIAPADFITLAEDSGILLLLEKWVLKTATQQAINWQDKGYPLTISVNISYRHFTGPDFVTLLLDTLDATKLEPAHLHLEITESTIISDLIKAQQIIRDIRQLGVKVFLDDFGTGYSSLTNLRRLTIDGLKIDSSLIEEIVKNRESRAITETIVSLAKALSLSVVAEGVETYEQLQILQQMNDMLIQGYLASRPVPANEFELLLQQGEIQWQPPSSSNQNFT